MPEAIRSLFPYFVSGVALLAALVLLVALWFLRRGRREPYWRMRRDATRKGWRWFLVALSLFMVAIGGSLLDRLLFRAPEPQPEHGVLSIWTPMATGDMASPGRAMALPTDAASNTPPVELPTTTPLTVLTQVVPVLPTANATPTQIPSVPARTPQPSPLASIPATVTAVPNRQPSTETPALSAVSAASITAQMPPPSPSSVPSSPAITPLDSLVTPLPNARVEITGVGIDVDSELRLSSPVDRLPAGTRRIFFSVDYSDMSDGAAWERVLLRGSKLVQGGAYLWAGGTSGTVTLFFGNSSGFDSGEYEIRLLFSGQMVASARFVVE